MERSWVAQLTQVIHLQQSAAMGESALKALNDAQPMRKELERERGDHRELKKAFDSALAHLQ